MFSKPFSKLVHWGGQSHKKRVYGFHEGSAADNNLLGNKGANLCEMSRLGLPVPPGFIITSEACLEFFHEFNNVMPGHLIDEYIKSVHEIERKSGRTFGVKDGNTFPLLLSVRSGAAKSMPGMMDTVLNLGLNDAILEGLIAYSKNSRFAYDTYRRFLQMFGTVVLKIDHNLYENIIIKIKKDKSIENDIDLDEADLKNIANEFKAITAVPEDPWQQLKMAIEAVFSSWFSPRAQKYRNINNISDDLGTAVTIQAMVFGNMNSYSGTGVGFTRNPGTGENVFYGEYLSNAEGEDVVAGIRTPLSLDDLRVLQPAIYDELLLIEKKLEHHYRDMQDIEFTVESGKLYILQTRNGKRTAKSDTVFVGDGDAYISFLLDTSEMRSNPNWEIIPSLAYESPSLAYESPSLAITASVKIAVDMVSEGLLT
eukprot:gene6051-12201_t